MLFQETKVHLYYKYSKCLLWTSMNVGKLRVMIIVPYFAFFCCWRIPVFKSNIQKFKCSNVQMFKCSNVPMVQWSNVTMLGCLDIQMFNDFGYSQGFFFRNAMYFNSFSGAGVSSGWVKHNFRLVSRFKSSNLSMFQSSNVQMFKCSNVQMFKCSNVLMFNFV